MFLTKIILLLLATCLIFSGWFLNNLFSGPTPEYFWNLVLNFNSDFALSHENQTHDWFIEQTNLICLILNTLIEGAEKSALFFYLYSIF